MVVDLASALQARGVENALALQLAGQAREHSLKVRRTRLLRADVQQQAIRHVVSH